MKITMKDFFDSSKESRDTDMPSIERVKALTMDKINCSAKPIKRIPRVASMAAILAVILAVSVTAYAVNNWNGFMNTGNLSRQEIREIMDMIENSGCSESTAEDGSVHYFDSQGNEMMVLSQKEARQIERERQENKITHNQETAGHLLDIDTLEVMPHSITPITSDKAGNIEDFLMGNGSMVILHPKGENGYWLNKGETVTITLEATGDCVVEFGVVRNGKMRETSSTKTKLHEFSYIAIKDGLYCFTAMYYSASADNFSNCSITIK